MEIYNDEHYQTNNCFDEFNNNNIRIMTFKHHLISIQYIPKKTFLQ